MSKLEKLLKEYKNYKIAIYGLSVETEKVLYELNSEFQVIGLLDGYKTEGMLYGKPVITMEQAIEMQVKLILVVARPGSCKAIAKRIDKLCIENQIHLFDIRGNNLCGTKKICYDFKNVNGITKRELFERILKKDIVSFDLFDTLIMRQTMFSTDVLELVDYELRKRGIIIQKFQEKRLSCEKELSKYTAPTLTDIYEYLKSAYDISDIDPQEAAELEWEIDSSLMIPREEVCELLFQVSRWKKNIYIVSDSYYKKNQLVEILDKFNIKVYTDILVSCEFHTGKTQRLFEKLKEIAGEQSYIHIGDDVVADVQNAENNEIEACHLYSGIDLLEMSGYLGMWDEIESLSDRIKVGMFTAKIFNSPFQFENDERRISIYNTYDIGYLFLAPVICDFIIWFRERVLENRLSNILFCSRDGYLIKKMYDELAGDTSSVYFLTSRTAAIRAGVENIDDIMYIEKMKFSGSLQEQLKERFGISIDSDDAISSNDLLDYSGILLDKAVKCREGYEKYIDKLNIQEGGVAFFDFVAKGTNQMFLGRLFKNHLKGFYFLQLKDEYIKKKRLNVETFYSVNEVNDSAIFENYYILETVLTSPAPSVKEINVSGIPVYEEETRTAENISCVQRVQDGISEYFKNYLELCPRNLIKVNKKLNEIMLTLLHGVFILDDDFLNLKVEDPFFNRVTNVTDLI